jgi:hypothetical protein
MFYTKRISATASMWRMRDLIRIVIGEWLETPGMDARAERSKRRYKVIKRIM